MSRTVWKYKLNMGATQMVLPLGSKVLLVGEQQGEPHIWVEQDPTDGADGIQYTFYIVGTGHELPTGHAHLDYQGSYFSGPFVWHIYKAW